MIEKFKSSTGLYVTQRKLETFLKLPRKAQELICSMLTDGNMVFTLSQQFPYVKDKEIAGLSSSEMLFLVAFNIYADLRYSDSLKNDYINNTASLISCNRLRTNDVVLVDGFEYTATFVFDFGEFYEPLEENYKVIIECEGKTSKWYKAPREEYKVFEFGEDEIYRDPLGCAEEVYNFIKERIDKKLGE